MDIKKSFITVLIITVLLLSAGCTTKTDESDAKEIKVDNANMYAIKDIALSEYLEFDVSDASIILDDSDVGYLDISLSDSDKEEELLLGYSNYKSVVVIKKAESTQNDIKQSDLDLEGFIDKVAIIDNYFTGRFDDNHFVFDFNGKRVSSSFSHKENVFLIDKDNMIYAYGENEISDAYVITLYTNDDVYFIYFT